MNEEKITTINSLDVESQIGESETLLDQMKTMVRQNKLAAFAAVVIIVIALAAIFAPLAAPYDPYAQTLTGSRPPARPIFWERTSWDATCSAVLYTGQGCPCWWGLSPR